MHAQPATRDDPHARRSDPTSSHEAVAAIASNSGLANHILHAARRLDPVPFDDNDLVELVEEQSGRKQQRNVIARARGLMEREGTFIRLGVRKRRGDDRKTLHFRLPRPGDVIVITPPVLGEQLVQIKTWRWCTRHQSVQDPGSFFCQHYARDGSACTPKPLYVKES
jgi:hypothetical protein